MMTLELWRPSESTGSSSRPLDPERCPVTATDRSNARWHTRHQCNRKPRADRIRPVRDYITNTTTDMPVCGVHAAVVDKAAERDEAYAARRRIDDAKRDNAKAAIERLKAFGIDATTDYQSRYGAGTGGYTGRVVIEPTHLLRVLENLDPDGDYRGGKE